MLVRDRRRAVQTPPFAVDLEDLGTCSQRIVDEHGPAEMQALLDEDSTRGTEHQPGDRRQQAGRKHPVGNALAEAGRLCVLRVDVQRIIIAAERREKEDIGCGDGLGKRHRFADYKG